MMKACILYTTQGAAVPDSYLKGALLTAIPLYPALHNLFPTGLRSDPSILGKERANVIQGLKLLDLLRKAGEGEMLMQSPSASPSSIHVLWGGRWRY